MRRVNGNLCDPVRQPADDVDRNHSEHQLGHLVVGGQDKKYFALYSQVELIIQPSISTSSHGMVQDACKEVVAKERMHKL